VVLVDSFDYEHNEQKEQMKELEENWVLKNLKYLKILSLKRALE